MVKFLPVALDWIPSTIKKSNNNFRAGGKGAETQTPLRDLEVGFRSQ